MSEWQPIETAPKDGEKIIVYDAGFGYCPFVYWDEEDDGWISEVFIWSGRPTHWMPFPKPPEMTADITNSQE